MCEGENEIASSVDPHFLNLFLVLKKMGFYFNWIQIFLMFTSQGTNCMFSKCAELEKKVINYSLKWLFLKL
jgi:hypothetical protein